MDQLNVLTNPISWGVLLFVAAILTIGRVSLRKSIKRRASSPSTYSPPSEKLNLQHSEDAYSAAAIVPLSNLDLSTEEPTKLRPFKPKYHLTMAIENTTLSDLLAMDKTYPSRLAFRKHTLANHRHEVLACNPAAIPAVFELYTWLTSTYLPCRFPTVYTLTGEALHNNITHTLLPLVPSSADDALHFLCENIDTEFFFLLPSTAPSDEGRYRLEAFMNCTPSGFSTRSKLNLLLSAIHNPVPHYSAKLEKSMDRFFAALPCGKIVRRANWNISTSAELFCLAGNHISEEEKAMRERGEMEEVDLKKAVLRCERQTLHRLPQTGALVFAFKTYQYPIQELRDEGSGEVLAEAIEGLALGSAPGIAEYKRQVIWGDKVNAFLRGEIDD